MKSESISELVKALVHFQSKMTAIKKDAINPFYKSKYATLDTIWESIRKTLAENGLGVSQTMGITQEGRSVLETTLYHTSGEWISGLQVVNPVKDDPQSLGSAISYARRYSLSAILGLVADEDDDGNIATKPDVKTEKPLANETSQKKDTITPAQIKKIFASAKDAEITPSQAKDYLKKVFQKESTKDLTASEASRLIEDIIAGKLNTGGDEEGHLIKAAKAMGAVKE